MFVYILFIIFLHNVNKTNRSRFLFLFCFDFKLKNKMVNNITTIEHNKKKTHAGKDKQMICYHFRYNVY